ncbi:MAG: glycosyltransferase family 4 protein [Chlorobi bacterium]|nr:glycosyltransferase family 4 protein [Chlorobiota bacterium]
MTNQWLVYLISAAGFALAGAAYYRYALRRHILDHPSERSSHRQPTVRGGGIIFAVAMLTAYFLYLFPAYPYFLAGFLLLSVTGFTDDKHRLSARVRFPIQAVAAVLILYDAGLWTADWPWYVKVAGLVTALGFVNAFNFMDGINGITTAYTVVLLLLLGAVNRHVGALPEQIFVLLLISLLVFGFFNFRRHALMFAGDVGTMALASVLLFVWTRLAVQTGAPVLLLLVAVYGIDSALTIIRRLLDGEKIWEAHRRHAYQKLVDKCGWSHLQVSTAYALVQFLIGLWVVGTDIYEKSLKIQWLILTIGLITFAFVYYLIIYRACEKHS